MRPASTEKQKTHWWLATRHAERVKRGTAANGSRILLEGDKNVLKLISVGVGSVVRALAAFPEDLSSIPSIHIESHDCL